MLHKLAAAATAGIEKTRIAVTELKLGMYVAELDCAWIDSPFLVHGFTIKSEEQLAQLRQHCRFVYVDITRGKRSPLSLHRPEPQTVHTETIGFLAHLPASRDLYRLTRDTIEELFSAIRSGEMFNLAGAGELVNRCVDNIIANPAPMLWLTMIKNKDRYTVEHSLNVAMLSLALGRQQGLAREHLEELGICALLHDVGKVKIPDEILNKEGSLDDKEYEVMKLHTVHGKKLLLGKRGLPDGAADIALSHHEQLDGSGYPQGLAEGQIPYLVRLVAIADAYDAMTSGRVYCDAKPPAEALKLMLENKGTHFDAELLSAFIDCLGVYPAGSIARLNTGETGFLLPGDDLSKLKPRLLVALDPQQQPVDCYEIDLRRDKQSNGRPYLVRALYPDGSFGLRLADLDDALLGQFCR